MNQSNNNTEDIKKIVDDLETFVDIGLDFLLQAIVDVIRELIDAPLAGLILLTEEEPVVAEYFKVSGWDDPSFLPQGHGLFSIPYKTGQTVSISNISAHPNSIGTPHEFPHPHIEAFLSAPLTHKERNLGSVFLAKTPGTGIFTEEDKELLQYFTRQVSLLIELSRRCVQAKEKVILEERKKMRDRLHDTVSQTLFALGQEVDLLDKWIDLPSTHRVDHRGKEFANQIRELVSQGLAEVRTTLFSMSEGIQLSRPFKKAFRHFIEEFQRASTIRTELIIRGNMETIPRPILQCISKVIGESLSNVQRHSKSCSAVVTITVEENKIITSIQDVGVGIGKEALTHLSSPTSHFGLRSMKSNVEEMNGVFKIFLNDDGGTTLRVELPLLWRL